MEGHRLQFQNINLYIGNKQILHDVSGMAEPGKLLVIMGPSGAGKTSLLNCLAGRQSITSGEITLNDSPITKDVKRKICYVLQQDIFFETLTLKDTLQFAANIRLPDNLTNEQKQETLDMIIDELDLKKCLDTMVGGAMMPGLSGGERKRANIACELLTDPSLILLDVSEKLKESGETQEKIITAGNRIKKQYDGDVLSYDPGSLIMEWKSEFNLDKTPSKLEKFKFWKNRSEVGEGNIHSSLLEIDVNKDNVFDEAKTKWPTGFWTQYKNLTLRSFKLSAVRILDKVKLIENILICLIVSAIWFQLPRSEETLRDRMGAVFFISIHWGFIPLFDAVTSFPFEKIVINKERAAGWYRLSAYFLGKCTSELLLILIQPFFFVTVVYWCIGLNGFVAFLASIGTICITALTGQSLGLFLGIINTEMRQAITVTILIQMTIMLLGGLFTRTLPVWLDWTKYLSFVYYSFHSMMYIEFKNAPPLSCSIDHNFTVFTICREDNATTIPSELVLDYYDIRLDYWQYFMPLFVFIIVFRSLSYITLRFVQKPV